MDKMPSQDRFSTVVRIELHIAGQCFNVAQVGGGRLIFDNPVTLPTIDGELTVYIDEVPHRWRVSPRPGVGPARIVSADLVAIQ